MLKEASNKQIMPYGVIKETMNSFQFVMNDQSNKPPTIRPERLANSHIVGFASQKLYFLILSIGSPTQWIFIFVYVKSLVMFIRHDLENPGFHIFSHYQ